MKSLGQDVLSLFGFIDKNMTQLGSQLTIDKPSCNKNV